jgi:rhodanese-related sulfurtransferase
VAAHCLRQLGYYYVASMMGGIKAWRDAGYPMSQD